ncbi:hypothetical protein ACFW1F_07565 [Streptomyces bungoensis]|uniref:hypothetical protein n=1 Tax=Streptomyces bungoensis TaxID=285568 RepID=UPI00368D276E
MPTHIYPAPTQAGQDWLLSCTPDQAAVRASWDAQQLAAIPTGPHWRVAEASLHRTLEAIRRIGAAPHGPVLAETRRGLAWWLLPPGITDELDDITVHPAGWELQCPSVERSMGGRWWLDIPDGTGQLTDPTLLGAAFGPGGYRHEGGGTQ